MNDFEYTRAASVTDAVEALRKPATFLIAGGTNLLDLMKEGVTRSSCLVDVNRLDLKKIIEHPSGGMTLGALATNSAVAYHPSIERNYPLIAQAILAGASPQLRNMATTGGNLLQRTRCYYFYDTAVPCNKREPGSGCPALTGLNRIHAVLGTSAHCIAVHPSDFCVALAAHGAIVNVEGQHGQRSIAFADFHRLPGDRPDLDTNLATGEMITSVELPPSPFTRHAAYIKARDRNSYAFALVSAAVAFTIKDNCLGEVRIALGGVASKPWRSQVVEESLRGSPPVPESFAVAAEALLADAKGFGENDFKIALAKRVIRRAFTDALSRGASL